jgi:hypothetical protein
MRKTLEVVDGLSTGSIENISHLKGHPHFSYTLDSVMNRSLMLELVDRADGMVVPCFVRLAWPASPFRSTATARSADRSPGWATWWARC